MIKNPFWEYIFKKNDNKLHFQLLETLPLFEELGPVNLKKLSTLLHYRTYRKGEVIFREHEPGESMYIVKTGKAKIFHAPQSGTDNEVAILEKGTFFGEVSLVDPQTRSATAVALEDSEFLVMFRGDLIALIDRDPRLASFLLVRLSKVIGQRLRESMILVNKRNKD